MSDCDHQPGNAIVGLRERKKLALRQRILDTSVDLFRARGYEAVTVDEICHELGISKATFFRYFTTKDSILTRWAGRIFEEFATAVFADEQGTQPYAEARIRHFFQLVGQRCVDDPHMVAAVIESGALDPARHREAWTKRQHRKTVLHRILEDGQRASEIRSHPDARMSALLLETSAHTAVAAWVFAGDHRPPQPSFSTMVDMFFVGIGRR